MPSRLCGAAEHDHQERIDDVELARGRPGRADHGEGRAGDAGDAAAEPEGQRSTSSRVDADRAAHGAVLHDGADLQAPARPIHAAARRRR